ncbi:MAG TPA: hypothetical protein VIJ94_03860, partial [Caulobacteraceae bacterium]
MADEAVRRFEVAWSDAICTDRTPSSGPERQQAYWALKADAKSAWGRRDLKTVAGAGLILHRARNLSDLGRRQLGAALLALGRFEQAREAFAAIQEVEATDGFEGARALAGLGRMQDALAALQGAAGGVEPPPAEADVARIVAEQGR